jgi:hypothetical protein
MLQGLIDNLTGAEQRRKKERRNSLLKAGAIGAGGLALGVGGGYLLSNRGAANLARKAVGGAAGKATQAAAPLTGEAKKAYNTSLVKRRLAAINAAGKNPEIDSAGTLHRYNTYISQNPEANRYLQKPPQGSPPQQGGIVGRIKQAFAGKKQQPSVSYKDRMRIKKAGIAQSISERAAALRKEGAYFKAAHPLIRLL